MVLVALAGTGVTLLPRSAEVPPADGERGAGVDGYPSHVEKSWFDRDLPSRPGPLAAVAELSDSRFLAISPHGDVWRIPQDEKVRDFFPALSADGRLLGYLRGPSTFVVRDLVDGKATRFSGISDNREVPDRTESWWTQPQVPVVPGSRRLAAPAPGLAVVRHRSRGCC